MDAVGRIPVDVPIAGLLQEHLVTLVLRVLVYEHSRSQASP
jgi:hypothetical protein